MASQQQEDPGGIPRLPRIDVGTATVLSALVALWIALGELDHLCAQVLDGDKVWSPASLTSSFDYPTAVQGWRFLGGTATGEGRAVEPRLTGWLVGYGLLDTLVTLAYLVVLLRLCRGLDRPGSRPGAPVLANPWPRRLILVGAGSDLLENLLITLGGALPWLLPAFSIAKLVALTAGVLTLWRARRERRRDAGVPGILRPLLGALYTHRYSLLIVLPIALLGLARGPDLLEQIPDIERRWLDPGELLDAVWAGLVTLALAVVTFSIGRLRTHGTWERLSPANGGPGPTPRPRPILLVWFIGPALAGVGALVALGIGLPVAWWPFAVFVGLPLLVGIGSVALRKTHPSWLHRPGRLPASPAQFRATAIVGDVLPAVLVAVAGLGAIRAFVGSVALGGAGFLAWLALGAGVATALGVWWLHARTLAWLADRADRMGPDRSGSLERSLVLLTPGLRPRRVVDCDRLTAEVRNHWLSWLALGVGLIGFVLLGIFPVPIADALGVIATFQLALGLLCVALAATVVALQASGSPEVFWVGPWRVPYAPLTTLFVVISLVGAVLGGSPTVHGVRDYSTAGPDASLTAGARPSLSAAFDAWLGTGSACERSVPGLPEGVTARPLLLYAAEGGGIRAAYWTAAGVDALATAAGPCGSAFLSSGASGGAVGLTMASVLPPGDALGAVRAISDPDALAEATDGLVVRDAVYSAAGIPLPSYGDGLPETWTDRAGLIERVWEERVPELAGPYLTRHQGWDWGPTGPLVLNSTSATSGCRALVSQVDLPSAGAAASCASGQPVAGSIDVVRCLGQRHASTAALLASRFPYVTPSAAVRCPVPDEPALGPRQPPAELQQLVDGGYVENTGIGTQLDLAADWLPLVRDHNATVLDAGAGTLVVPALLYFDNGTGSDLVASDSRKKLEILVPVLTALAAKASLYSARSQLQRADALLAADQVLPRSTPPEVVSAVAAWRPHATYVLYQATRPSVAAPLGWVLSRRSQDTLDTALREQGPVGVLDYSTFDELTALLAPAP